MILQLLWLIIPLATGALIAALVHLLDHTRFAVKGVVAPYFTAFALLFTLFAAHTTVDVWEKIRRTNLLLFTEASSMRGMLRIAVPFDQGRAQVQAAFDDLLREILQQEAVRRAGLQIGAIYGERAPSAFSHLYRIAADPANFGNNPSANAAFYHAVDTFRAAWFERSELGKRHVAAVSYQILVLFGVLTQAALALSHAGNPRALWASVALYSIAFAGSLGIIYLLDHAESLTDLIARTAIEDVARNPLGFGPTDPWDTLDPDERFGP
ncbi:MAG: hypothetical protein U1E14_21420 [Geminicoccaceae bacterium]